ncbi:GumC family protein [Leeuwenhoekiella sp. A16]|uniref:GumC family protein n=1 Tax=Leeuwenhoekiella sp. A16 TaxID=3141462 RepID=UPI003A7F93E9
MEENRHIPVYFEEDDMNIREELEKYVRYWPWFLITAIFFLAIAFLYLKVTTPAYNTSASIIIKDDDTKSAGSDLAAFADLGLMEGLGTNSIENEIGILRSRRMMTNVVNALGVNVQYYEDETFKNTEIYKSAPFEVEIIALRESDFEKAIEEEENTFSVHVSGNAYKLIQNDSEKEINAVAEKITDLGFAEVIFHYTHENNLNEDGEAIDDFTIKFRPVQSVVDQYRELLNVTLVDDNATLIELSLEDPVKAKARDILDQLIFEYNKEAIEDKNLVATNTALFIDDRLDIINRELDSVEVGKEEFKEENQLTNIEAESELFITNASDYRKRKQEIDTQLELANSMIDYIQNSSASDLLPANLGIEETGVNQQITEYNNLVLERNRILSGSTEFNPVVKRLSSQIDQMKESVAASLQRMRSNLQIAQRDLNQHVGTIGSQIADVPAKERLFRGIERQQNIKEALYLFLLQKREETSLTLAVTAPKAKIVDSAFSDKDPVSPKPVIVMGGALVAGLALPFMFLYVQNLLNNKVQRREDIEKASKVIPIVGEIPQVPKRDSDLVKENDRSVLSEAFRILITNLQYLLIDKNNDKKGFCLYVTSTVKGEGKTFTAVNLAITLANTGKKVLIMGADLRNPQLQRYELDVRHRLGVSDYLVNNDILLNDIIEPSTLHPNLQILPSGSIPPNPAELLRRDKLGELFKELESLYDYIIVDTAPSMLVADTFLINKYADLTLYVVRAGYTEKKLLDFAIDAKESKKLHDVSFVLNDVQAANFGYGNKYGYVYGESAPSFWQRLRSKF